MRRKRAGGRGEGNEGSNAQEREDGEDQGNLNILYDHHPEKSIARRNRYNPLFPYKSLVLCPKCKKPFTGSCPRGKSGGHYPTYSCFRKHKYFGVPKNKFDEMFESFVRRLKFAPWIFDLVEREFTNIYHNKKTELAQASLDAHRTIADFRSEQKAKAAAFVATTSPILRAQLEKEIEDIEVLIKMASGESQKIDISTDDITEFKKQGQYYLEHLPELLLNPENPRQQAALFGLVFDAFPTYEEIAFGTPKLSWLFELSSESATAKSALVTLRSLDWNTIESTIKKWKEAFKYIQLPLA